MFHYYIQKWVRLVPLKTSKAVLLLVIFILLIIFYIRHFKREIPTGYGLEIQQSKQLRPKDNFIFNEFNTSSYHTLDEAYLWFEKLEIEFPELLSVINIGRTAEKRNLKVLKISVIETRTKKAVWLDAGTHANEWIGPAALLHVIKMFILLHVNGQNKEWTHLLESLDWYILPFFNPDGYIFSWEKDRMWRKNRSFDLGQKKPGCIGVDLNRNWDSHWGENNADHDPCSQMYIGPAPFSEMETRAVAKFLSRNNYTILTYISFHSFSQLVMFPFSFSDRLVPENFKELEVIADEIAEAMKNVYGTEYLSGKISDLLGTVGGTSVDYTYLKLGIKLSFGIELRDTGEHGFLLPSTEIIPTAEEVLAALRVIGHHTLKEANKPQV